MSKALKRERIALAAAQRPLIFKHAWGMGIELVESFINDTSPHWRFFRRGQVLMQYWPATERYWMTSDGAKGTCPLANVVDFLAAEIHDLKGTVTDV